MVPEKEIPPSIHGQKAYLEDLKQEIIEVAGEHATMAEVALNRVLRALAYNGTAYSHAADTIIGETGHILEIVAPEAGQLLSEFGGIILERKINWLAVGRFLSSEPRKISFYSQIPTEDFPFYQVIQQGGLSLPEEKLAISKWLLGLTEAESKVTAQIEAKLAEEVDLELTEQEARRALRRTTEAMISGSSFSQGDLDILREYGEQMLARGHTPDDIIMFLRSKFPNE